LNRLDLRDLNFWGRRARIKILEDRMIGMVIARAAMATDDSVRTEMTKLEWTAKLLKAEEEEE